MADIEKARTHGERHPNGKWYWESAAAGGKGDWRTIKNADKKPAPEKKDDEPPAKTRGNTVFIHDVYGTQVKISKHPQNRYDFVAEYDGKKKVISDPSFYEEKISSGVKKILANQLGIEGKKGEAIPLDTKVSFVSATGEHKTGKVISKPHQTKDKNGNYKMQGYTVSVNGVSYYVKPHQMTIEKAEDLLFGPAEPAPRSEIEKAEDVLGL